MKLKNTFISLSIIVIALLASGVFFIYLKEEQNTPQNIQENKVFFDFLIRQIEIAHTPDTSHSDYDQSLKSIVFLLNDEESDNIVNDLKTQTNKLTKSFTKKERIKNEVLKKEKISQELNHNLKLSLHKNIVSKLNENKHIFSGINKTFKDWGKSIPIFKDLTKGLDVSITDKEKVKELQSLMELNKILYDNNNSDQRNTNKLTGLLKESNLNSEEFIKNESDLRKLFIVEGDITSLQTKLKKIDDNIKIIQKQIDNTLKSQLMPHWQKFSLNKERKHYLEEQTRLQQIAKIIIVIGILIILVMLTIFLRIFPALDRLVKMAKNISSGNFSKNFKEIPNNEIGVLMETFNSMSQEISLHIEKLKENEEQKLILSDSLQKVRNMAQLGEFSAKMSHELKNPLSILNFCLSDALELLKSNEINKALIELEKSKEAVKRIKNISNILGSNHKVQKLGPIFINKTIENLVELYATKLKSKDFSIKFYKNSSQDKIQASSLEIQSAISNLIDNAIEASNKEDNKEISIMTYNSNNSIKIEISNLGEEIKHPDLLFTTFNSTKDGANRGLGLIIVKDIIESFKGSISYFYKENKNVFSIELPLFIN